MKLNPERVEGFIHLEGYTTGPSATQQEKVSRDFNVSSASQVPSNDPLLGAYTFLGFNNMLIYNAYQ